MSLRRFDRIERIEVPRALYAPVERLAVDRCLPLAESTLRFDGSLKNAVTSIYLQGVMDGVEVAEHAAGRAIFSHPEPPPVLEGL